jgi:hypothetical protein
MQYPDSSILTVITYSVKWVTMDTMNMVSFMTQAEVSLSATTSRLAVGPSQSTGFCDILHFFQSSCGAYPEGTGCSAGWNVNFITHLHVVLRLEMPGPLVPPTCIHGGWVLRHRDNFTFIYYPDTLRPFYITF